MLLLGVADCCWIVDVFAFTGSSVLPTSATLCLDLPGFASLKRQTNGKQFVLFKSRNNQGLVIQV